MFKPINLPGHDYLAHYLQSAEVHYEKYTTINNHISLPF